MGDTALGLELGVGYELGQVLGTEHAGGTGKGSIGVTCSHQLPITLNLLHGLDGLGLNGRGIIPGGPGGIPLHLQGAPGLERRPGVGRHNGNAPGHMGAVAKVKHRGHRIPLDQERIKYTREVFNGVKVCAAGCTTRLGTLHIGRIHHVRNHHVDAEQGMATDNILGSRVDDTAAQQAIIR